MEAGTICMLSFLVSVFFFFPVYLFMGCAEASLVHLGFLCLRQLGATHCSVWASVASLVAEHRL